MLSEKNMEKNITVAIALRLRVARKASGYKTSKEFAKKHNIAPSTYSQHETGKRLLSIESLLSYGETMEVNPSWILTGEGPPCFANTGDNDRESKILKAIRSLEEAGEIRAAPGALITNARYSNIDIMLFKSLLLAIIPFLKNFNDNIAHEHFIDFSFQVYNQVVMTNVDSKTKRALIEISVQSFFKGMEASRVKEIAQKGENL